jgi:hypothetical protein
MGIQNLNQETYIKDFLIVASGEPVVGCAFDGDLFFVHHHIKDSEAWDAMVNEKMGAPKGASNAAGYSKALKLSEGTFPVIYAGPLDDKNGFCIWALPKGSTIADFQKVVDDYVSPVAADNECSRIEPSNFLGSRNLHPDFYVQDALAIANAP